jgi:S-DNA-T family DNA segregation ATPase FtsK/SpoIIIE
MDERKRSEVLAFFWFAVSVLMLLALLSYTPYDIPYEVSTPNSPTHNFVGIAGSYTAWVLFLFFGKTAYLLVPLFLFWALARWAGKKGQRPWVKIFATVIFLVSSCALFSLIGQDLPATRFGFGGIVGFFTSVFLTNLFGQASLFVALCLFLLSIILATELLVLQIAVDFFKRVWKISKPVLMKGATSKPSAPAPVLKKEDPRKPSLLVKKEAVMDRLKPQINLNTLNKPPAVAQKPEIKIAAPKEAIKKQEPPVKASVPAAPAPEPVDEGSYRLPPLEMLHYPPSVDQGKMKDDLEVSSRILEDTLRDFGIDVKVVEVEQGPTITRYELQPAAGVKVQRITALEDDIALAMRATSVRIIAPIPGKSRVGIEVPNASASTVYIRDVLSSAEFQNERSKITIAIGKDTAGSPLVCNLADMPHLLIAGATNTGKSVCINSILTSILFKATPEEVKFILVDPKMVELHFYNDLPHLICPVVTEKSKVPGVLAWLVSEMERRYRVLSKVGAKNLMGFNEKVENKQIRPEMLRIDESNQDEPVIVKKMPYIVIVIDELADLMVSSAKEIEDAIMRLAQLARAVGIHMILATQRPSVDVITGVIKANFPARIAFQVASKVDSRTILDENGADKLLGRGDLLLMDPRKAKLIRGQGAWVQDIEIEKLTQQIKSQRKPLYQESVIQSVEKKQVLGDFKRDEVYEEAKRLVVDSGQASVSLVQRRLGVGYTRAARLIDMMEEDGVVGPYRGAKPREVLIKPAQKNEEVEQV